MTKVWGGEVSYLVKDFYNFKFCCFYSTFFWSPPAPPVSTMFLKFVYSPYLTPTTLSYFNFRSHFSLSLHFLFPPTHQRVERPPTWKYPHLFDSTACLCLPPSPLLVSHKEFLAKACDFRPSSGFPYFSILNLRPGTCQIQGLPLRGSLHTSDCPCCTYIWSPTTSFNRRTSPLPVPRGFHRVILSLIPCASASPSP